MASRKGKPAPLDATKKGGKPKEPPPPSPRTLAAIEEKAAQERAERDGAVQEFLMDVLDRVDAIEEEKEIQRMLIPYAVDRVLDEAMKALELTMVPRPPDWRGEGTGNWAEDDEPETPVIDTWARGAIPIKRRPPPVVSEMRSPTIASSNGLSRTALRKVSGSVRNSRSPSRRGSNAGSERGGGPAESIMSNSRINTSAMKRLVDLSSRAPLPTLPVAPPPLPKLMQEIQARKKELASNNVEEEQRLREEIAARQAEGKLRQERADRDAADVARLAEVQKGLRNQSYGYSHTGELVVLQNVDVERLPAATVGPRVAIADGDPSEGKAMARGRSGRNLNRELSKSGDATSAVSPELFKSSSKTGGATSAPMELLRSLSKSAGATSAPPELVKSLSKKSTVPLEGENSANPNGMSPKQLARSKSGKLGDEKDGKKSNGKAGVPDFIPAAQAGTARTGVLVESIKLSSGVTLKMGTSVRSGGAVQHDPGHVTRKEYLAMREGEGLRAAISDRKREKPVTNLVLPIIDKPKSR